MKTGHKIAIVIPTLVYFDGLAALLNSLTTPVVPIVVPNWRLEKSVAASWNWGIDKAAAMGCDYVLVCNDDITFKNGSEPVAMAAFLAENPDYLLVGGNDLNKFADDPSKNTEETPDFACFMVRSDFPDHVGYFDENIRPAYFEDNDMHRRITLSGARTCQLGAAPFYHEGSRTQYANRGLPVVPPPQFERNRAYYVEKWGGVPGSERYVHPYNDDKYDYKMWRP
jgi:hypothetical protein